MAQITSELWKTLWRTKNTEKEYGFDIDGVWYGPEQEVEHSAASALYEDFGIGNATTAQLDISLYAQDIPRGATIKRYIRLRNGDRVSEWLPKGVFFVNYRAHDGDYWAVEAYDAMRKAEAVWEPDQNLEFPMSMPAAVAEFARIMGVEIDSRTSLNSAYTIDYPANEYTIRQELCFIAAAHGGNWVMTGEGKLLLVPLRSIPGETSYLVTERGDAITFGGVRILVGPDGAGASSGASGFDKFFVGMAVTASEDNGERKPISRVTLWVDDNNCLTAGDDTGGGIEADCPHATQAMVDNLLDQLQGYVYRAYSGDDADIDPAFELGDGVTVDGVYSVIARIDDDGSGYPSLSAPGEKILESEYPTAGPMTQEFNRQIAQTRSQITKTAGEIRLEVMNEVEGLSAAIEVDLTEIIGRVEDAEAGLSQTVRLGADGLTITNAAGSRLEIDGGQLTANSIEAEAFKANSITADKLSITGSISWTDLATDAQNQVTSAQNMSLSAYNLANSASGNASSALNNLQLLANGQYAGGTFIDGKNLYAPNLYGDTINLMDGYSRQVGAISLQQSATYAMDISSNLSLRMQAAYGYNVYLSNNNAWLQMVGGNLTLSGNLIVSGHNFGTSLPATGTYGQVFFLLGG